MSRRRWWHRQATKSLSDGAEPGRDRAAAFHLRKENISSEVYRGSVVKVYGWIFMSNPNPNFDPNRDLNTTQSLIGTPILKLTLIFT